MNVRQELSLGDRIRLIRSALGLSQQALSAKTKFPKAQLGHWETGHRHAGVDSLIALAQATGCNFQWLATGQGDPWTPELPYGPLIEACIEVALPLAGQADPAALAMELYRRACAVGLAVQRGTRTELVAALQAMAKA